MEALKPNPVTGDAAASQANVPAGSLDGRSVTKKSATDADVAPVHGCAVDCCGCGCSCTIL